MHYDREDLIKKITALIRETGPLHCFGSRGTMDLNTGIMKTNCDCAGDDEEKHRENYKKLIDKENQMCELIKEVTGTEVFVFPGTYTDYYFTEKVGSTRMRGKTVLGLDFNGEIKKARSYA